MITEPSATELAYKAVIDSALDQLQKIYPGETNWGVNDGIARLLKDRDILKASVGAALDAIFSVYPDRNIVDIKGDLAAILDSRQQALLQVFDLTYEVEDLKEKLQAALEVRDSMFRTMAECERQVQEITGGHSTGLRGDPQ